MANLRFQVVEEAFKKKPLEVAAPAERPSEYFGKYVFTRSKMYKYLQRDVYEMKMVGIHKVSSMINTGDVGSHAE